MDHDTMTEAAPMSRARAAATLVGIAVVLAASGWGLVAVLGFAAPRRPPTWDELSLLARSGSISFEAAWPVAAPFVWGLWLWATANFVVSLALALAERVAGGAAWLATAEAIAGAAGFGPMRRLLRGVVAAAFAVSLVATRPATPAGAGAAPRPAVEQVIDPPPAAILIQPAAPAEPGLAVSSLAPQQGEARTIRHTVRAGQVLSRISEWYYKDWKRYPRLAADNGLPNVNLVPTGRVLTITEPARTEPLPTSVAPPADGEGTHVVRAGETFPSIAAAVYGDAGYADDIYWRNWAAIRDVYRPPAGLALVLPIIPDAPSGPRATPRPAPSSPPSPAPAAADERGPAAPEPPILARPWRLVILPPPTPVPAPLPAATPAPAPTPAIVATAAPPPATAVAPAGAAAAPAAPTPRLAVPVDAEDAALAAVSLAAGFLAGLATARRARAGRGPGAADPAMTVGRRRALRRPSRAWRLGDPRFSPLGPAARAALDRTTGAARRGLSLLTRRRPPAGDDADPRMTTPGRLLAALAEAGWPGAAVATLEAVGGTGVRCDVRLDPTAARDPKQELPELLAALRARLGPAVAGDVTDDGFLSLALAGLPPAEAGAADDDTVPPPPLLHIGQADGAPLAASPAGVGGGLLLAGTGAATAFDAALVSLLDAYAPADVRLALIAPEALGAPYRGAAQLVEPPVPPGSPAAHSMLEALLAGPAWDRPRLLLAVAEPAAAAGPLLRALAAENGARGIDVLVAAEDAGALDPALVAACRGRVLGRLPSAALSRALAGREGAEALAPGAGWWLFNRRPPRPIALLAVDDEDRRAALAASDPAAVAAAAEPPADDQTDTPTAAVAKPEVEIEGEVAGEEPVAAMEPPAPAPSDAQEPGPTPLTPPSGALAVRLLGPLQISVDGRPAPDLGPRVAELLLYLILHPAGAHKPALAEALWPDAPDDENQRDALSQAKRNLARWLERVTGVPADAAIAGRAPGEPYRLAVPRLWTDLAALTDQLALADETADDEAAGRVILEALRLYRGRVGEGLRAGVGADEDWSEPHAEAAARTVAAAGARLAAAQARAGRHAFAIRLYETLHGLAIYHEDEEVLRHELDCYAEVGDARGLQRAYADFRAWARRHWAAEPEAETRTHYRRLRARLGPPPLPAPPAGGEDERAAAQ